MVSIDDLFDDKRYVGKIQKKLAFLFQIAEFEASRGGKLGMEIGSVRERVIIALLRTCFDKKNVDADMPITKSEVDVVLFDKELSIKTKTGNSLSGIKSIWTVDRDKIHSFVDSYKPTAGMILVQIVWNTVNGGFFYIPIDVQREIFEKLGRDKYLTIPPKNTNPRGVAFSNIAMKMMISNSKTKSIKIKWQRKEQEIDIYKKWEEYWDADWDRLVS